MDCFLLILPCNTEHLKIFELPFNVIFMAYVLDSFLFHLLHLDKSLASGNLKDSP